VAGDPATYVSARDSSFAVYNAKEPMTLFELQAWLGHRTPNTTQYYAKINPTTLSKA
jgi:integrase